MIEYMSEPSDNTSIIGYLRLWRMLLIHTHQHLVVLLLSGTVDQRKVGQYKDGKHHQNNDQYDEYSC
jgi:hypothetical protein